MEHSSSTHSIENKKLQPMTQKEQKAFNKWCKDFRVSSQYIKKTEYYPTEYNYEQPMNPTLLDWIENTISKLFR